LAVLAALDINRATMYIFVIAEVIQDVLAALDINRATMYIFVCATNINCSCVRALLYRIEIRCANPLYEM